MSPAKRPSPSSRSSSRPPAGGAKRGASGAGSARSSKGPSRPGKPRTGGSGRGTSAGGASGSGRPGGASRGTGSSGGRSGGPSRSGGPGRSARPTGAGRSGSGSRRRGDDERGGRDDEWDDRPRRAGGSSATGPGSRGKARRPAGPSGRGRPASRSGSSSGRPPSRRRDDEERARDEIPNIPGQGALTRKGAGWLKKVDALDKAGIKKPPRGGPGGASDAWRKAAGLDDGDGGEGPARPLRRTSKDREPGRASFASRALGEEDELIVLDDDDADGVRSEASRAVSRGARPSPADDVTLEDEVRAELARAVSTPKVARSEARLADAARAFRRERFPEAAKILKPLAEQAPGVAAIRELYGLTLYRQGRWRLAAKELEAFRLLSGSTEQHPVLADCYRALRQWSVVEALWDELRQASPSADLVVEGRIVAAGALADQKRVPDAIRLLEAGWKRPKRPQVHHLRRGYALADLYERAGEVARARELFAWVAAHDDGETGAAGRLRSLR